MPLAANTWYQIAFLPFTDAAWTGYTPPYPTLNPLVLDAVVNATTMLVFCSDVGPPATLHFAGGYVEIDEAVVDFGATVAQTTQASPYSSPSETIYSMKDPLGVWLSYSTASASVRTMSSGDAVTLGNFIN